MSIILDKVSEEVTEPLMEVIIMLRVYSKNLLRALNPF